jgi:hypothetical protein
MGPFYLLDQHDEIKALMRHLIKESMKDGKEREFKVCCNPETGKSRFTTAYTGKETMMKYSPKCRKKEEVSIAFHTHPCKECWDMSINDLWIMFDEDVEMACVGTVDKNNKPMMSCFYIGAHEFNRDEALKVLKTLHVAQKMVEL